jgi:hypothetical protein
MNYEVCTYNNRDLFQEALDSLPPHKTLHSFQYAAPHVVAVYEWEAKGYIPQSIPAMARATA